MPTVRMRGTRVLPSHMKMFWWLSVAIVAIWPAEVVWFVAPFVPHSTDEIQRVVRQTGEICLIAVTALMSAMTLGVAWLAGHRKQNWARREYALVFPVGQVLPPVVILVNMYESRGHCRTHAFFVRAWDA